MLLSTTELEKLIDDANESLEDSEDSDIAVVILHKDEGQGLGLTVAGGIDQEVKEITVSLEIFYHSFAEYNQGK